MKKSTQTIRILCVIARFLIYYSCKPRNPSIKSLYIYMVVETVLKNFGHKNKLFPTQRINEKNFLKKLINLR